MPNRVYDDKKSDEDLRRITGINSEQEKAMDREAYNEQARNILAREQAAATQGTAAASGTAAGTGIKQKTPDEINNAEDAVGKGYTGPKPDDSPEESKRKQQVLKHFKSRWAGGKKKGLLLGALGGGGLIGGIGLFSITLGPLQFIHISNMLTDHDFSALDDANDDKAFRLLRFAFYASRGEVEKTRLGFLGNTLANRFEIRLNSVGLKSAYTQAFGFRDGVVVDRSHPNYRGMNDQQLIKHFKERGVDLKPGSTFGASPELNRSGVFVVDLRPGQLGFWASNRFVKVSLQEAGLNKVTSALATNLLRKRGGITLHPIKRLDAKVLRKLEGAFQDWRKERTERIKRGTYTAPRANSGASEDSDPNQRASADSAAEAGQNTIDEGARANADINAGDGGALTRFSNAVNTKWAVGGIAALTIPCVLRALADDASDVKHEQVMLPAMRMGMEAIAVGQQGESGHDVTLEQMGFYNRLANGADRNGNPSTWSDSSVFQAMNGAEPNVGDPPPQTLRNINKGTPFDFLNEGEIGVTLDVVCSTAVQGGIMIISFLGGPVSTALGILAMPVTQALLHEGAKWMAGSPLDVNAQGSEWGSIVAYGSRLASNDQALASGGTVVTKETEQSIDSGSKYVLDEEFRSKSLAYRLFNPHDYRTPVARFVDSQNVKSATTNVASLSNNFLNIGNQFGNLAFGLFSGRSSADNSGYYDYGFPRVAVDPSVYMKADYANPYKTADDAADILNGPGGQDYIDKAKRCNGATIKKDDDGLWNVVSDPESTPKMTDYRSPDCSADGSVAASSEATNTAVASSNQDRGWDSGFSSLANGLGNTFFGLFSGRTSAQSAPDTPRVKAVASDKNWETITQFMNSTVNMNGLGCKFGNDQACADIGYAAASDSGDGSGATPVGPGGDARSIAKLINDNDNITFQTPEKERAFQEVVNTGAQKDCGGTIPISPVLLSVIQSLADPAKGASAYKIVLGVFSTGHSCGSGYHSKGMAIDINGVARGGVSTGNRLHFNALNASQLTLVTQFYSDVVASFPDKTGGMGQINCFQAPPKRPGVIYFNDSCDHLHVDVRKN